MARWVTDQVAVGGIAISPANWKELVEEAEISAVVNLRSEHQDSFVPPMPTAYLWLPVDDHSDPTPEQLLLGAKSIETAVRNGQTVLVHCKMGIGRSPTLAAAYLILTGLSVDEAMRRIEGSPRPPYGPAVSRATLNDFAASLQTNERTN